MKLLLVDDEPGIREGLAALLRRKGHQVTTAGDCAGAAKALEEGEFDLVLTDWRLPDGRADDFLVVCGCPIVAMSGHPEEVIGHGSVGTVLTKPVLPMHILEVMAEMESSGFDDGDPPPLPRDVCELVGRARAMLGCEGKLVDDGAFVVLTAPLGDTDADDLAVLGGDQRPVHGDGDALIEIRWCRDGRPDFDTIVVRAGEEWPPEDEFAVDFDGAELSGDRFGVCLDRAAEARAAGRRVWFLNVPDSLLCWTSDQGRVDDMPMRAKVGPRLPAPLADLWS